jgi:exopolyphosphatase/guanosine-5'-triphosphate,3'-diphosphate pyrophosphatase
VLEDEAALRAALRRLAARHDPDPGHAAQVARLALLLFDALSTLHGLGDRERRLLEVAAWLHDIGWSHGGATKHHKRSRDMILDADLPGLSDEERLLCALIARYHRKAEPDPERHRRFRKLAPPARERVEWLAGILRVADGLDRSHLDRVRALDVEIHERHLVIHLHAEEDCATEIWGAERKARLLERKAQRHLRLTPRIAKRDE